VVGGEGIVDLIFIAPGSFTGGKLKNPRLSHFYSSYFEFSDSPRIGFGLSNSVRIYPEEIKTIYPEANEFFSKTKKLYIQAMRYIGSYNFKDDFFFDISKLNPRTYVWRVWNDRPDRLWENRYYLSPVDDENIKDNSFWSVIEKYFSEFKEIKPEPYKKFVMDHDYFTCLIPVHWKLKMDKNSFGKFGILCFFAFLLQIISINVSMAEEMYSFKLFIKKERIKRFRRIRISSL